MSVSASNGIDLEVLEYAIDALGDDLLLGVGETYIYLPERVECSGRSPAIHLGTTSDGTVEDEDEVSSDVQSITWKKTRKELVLLGWGMGSFIC